MITSFPPGRIDQWAEANPQSLALSAGLDRITYGDLKTRSNQLAHLLREVGVGPEVLVGLYFHRSIEFIVAALAVWKAGGAYVPLDPEYPSERIALMIQDAAVGAIVTNSEDSSKLPIWDVPVVLLDLSAADIAMQKTTRPEVDLDDRLLAYAIFTSGSTGCPNGVEVTHGNLSNLIAWHHDAFALTAMDRAMFAASPGFDAAVWEVWPYLAAGASVHLPDETTCRAPELLREWLLDHEITIGFAATPLAEAMMTMDWPHDAKLRILLTGADNLHRFPSPDLPFSLVNNYGPTECTVVATSGRVLAQGAAGGYPSIGKPISNTEIYILDEQRKPVRKGEEGEIYIGGALVARGYRNRPELTADRFIANPLQKEGGRLFRTGDRARELPNGEIAFLGRLDNQVKISGYRIELAEVASALNRHPMVRAAEVVSERNCTGVARLVAYIVFGAGERPTPTELRDFLRCHLPDYMIPPAFVALHRLPVTPHGKVDRALLPKPDPENQLRDAPCQAHSPVEAIVVDVLAKTLRVPDVRLDDNFFRLGGHSLLGTQLITRLRERFGVEIGLRALFANPTASGLSAEIETLILAQPSDPARQAQA